MNQQKRELKISQLQQSVTEMKDQDFRCKEMNKIHQKADQKLKMRRMHVEFEQKELYSNLQKVLDMEF